MSEDVLTRTARLVEEKYYGKYRGFVADNEDPEKRGRLRLTVPSVLAEEVTGWALPCLPFGGLADQGLFSVPEPDAQVWVEFEEGDLSHPIWTGTFWQTGDDAPEEAAITPPTTRLLKTPTGHLLQFDDEEGAERILLMHSGGAQVEIDSEGTITLTDGGGGKVTLDAAAGEFRVEDANGNVLTTSSAGTTVEDSNGSKIEMAAAGVTVKATQVVVEGTQVHLGGQATEGVIKGLSFLTKYMTHIHPSAMGPTGPPIPQGEMSDLSTTVMTK